MDPADLRALNETFATIERGINNLSARLEATMAFVASLPGAAQVETSSIEDRLATTRLDPVLSLLAPPTRHFIDEAIRELQTMSALINAADTASPDRAAAYHLPLRKTNGASTEFAGADGGELLGKEGRADTVSPDRATAHHPPPRKTNGASSGFAEADGGELRGKEGRSERRFTFPRKSI